MEQSVAGVMMIIGETMLSIWQKYGSSNKTDRACELSSGFKAALLAAKTPSTFHTPV